MGDGEVGRSCAGVRLSLQDQQPPRVHDLPVVEPDGGLRVRALSEREITLTSIRKAPPPGILAASGLVAGEGLAGVVLAGLVAARLVARAMAPRLPRVSGDFAVSVMLRAVGAFLYRAGRSSR